LEKVLIRRMIYQVKISKFIAEKNSKSGDALIDWIDDPSTSEDEVFSFLELSSAKSLQVSPDFQLVIEGKAPTG
jgi:hypothetical protein